MRPKANGYSLMKYTGLILESVYTIIQFKKRLVKLESLSKKILKKCARSKNCGEGIMKRKQSKKRSRID